MTADAGMAVVSPRISALDVVSPAAEDVRIEMHEQYTASRPCLKSAADALGVALNCH